MDVKNKIVIVTGASSGIGLATAKLLTERGAKLALVSRSGVLCNPGKYRSRCVPSHLRSEPGGTAGCHSAGHSHHEKARAGCDNPDGSGYLTGVERSLHDKQ